MKRLTALILAAGMLASMLASCSAPDAEDDVYCNLDHISMELPQGMVLTTLEKAADVNDYYRPDPEFTYLLQQAIGFADGKMYARPQYPADVIHQGHNAILAYLEDYRPVDYLEVYTTDDFSAYETLPLDLPEETQWTRVLWDDTTGTIQMYDIRDQQYNGETFPSTRLVFDTDGRLLSEEPVDLHDDVIFNEMLYLIGGDLYYNNHIIGDVHGRPSLRVLRAGEHQSEILQTRIRGMCCADGMVYFVKGGETDDYHYSPDKTLYRYDPSTQEIETILEFTGQVLFWENLHYDSKNGVLYAVENGILYGLDTKTGRVVPVLSAYDASVSICGGYDDKIVLCTDASKLTSYVMPETPLSIYEDMKTLNFCRLMDPMRASSIDTGASGTFAFKILYANDYKYQSATTYASDDAEEYAFTIAKKLLAGDTDFDLFYVTTEMFELFDPVYFEELSRYSILDSLYGKYIPGVRELCSLDGKPVLIPVNLMTRQLCLDTSVTAKPFEFPETFRDFLKLHEAEYNEGAFFMKGNRLHLLLSPWFEQTAANMLAGTVSDKVCRETFETLYELGVQFSSSAKVSLQNRSKVSVLAEAVPVSGGFVPYGKKENQNMTKILPVHEDMKQVITGEFWAVNPNSPNKEAAVIWLAAQQHQQYEGAMQYDAGLFDVPVTESNVGSEAAYRVMREQIASGILACTVPDFVNRLSDHFEYIESGKLTPEDAADELWRYLKMIRDE